MIAALLRGLVREIQQAVEITGDMHLARRALHRRQPVQGLTDAGPQDIGINIGLGQEMPGAAALLIEQRRHDMQRLDILVIAPYRQTLSLGQGNLKFGGEFIHAHTRHPLQRNSVA